MSDITVVTPSIPTRQRLLNRARRSVTKQTLRPAEHIVELDTDRNGAAITRQRGLDRVSTEWTAFLDDDDVFLPEHLYKLRSFAADTGADYVYSWYTVVGGTDPLPHFGIEFDHCRPTQTTITVLVRSELAKDCGFLGELPDTLTPDGNVYGEDYQFTLRCVSAGGYIVHLPERTWLWHHHMGNTSGLAVNW